MTELGLEAGDLARHADRIDTILANLGAEVVAPDVRSFDDGAIVIDVDATLPGPFLPRPTELRIRERWLPRANGRYQRAEYAYDFIEHPLDRRRAFHAHDVARFIAEHDVVTHEHCEELLGRPVYEHYFGFPVDAYEAIHQFTVLWGQPDGLDCAALRPMAA